MASYIVVLKKEHADALEQFAAQTNPMHSVMKIINGFACEITQEQKDALEQNPKVKYLEADGQVTLTDNAPAAAAAPPYAEVRAACCCCCCCCCSAVATAVRRPPANLPAAQDNIFVKILDGAIPSYKVFIS